MGFLSSFMKGFNDDEQEILDMVNDEDDELLSRDYRKTGKFNSDSNYGWYECPKCHKKFRASGMDVDHIVPKSKGGDNSRYNLQLLCQHCNRSKRDNTDETEMDIIRRKKELQKQDEQDKLFLRNSKKYI